MNDREPGAVVVAIAASDGGREALRELFQCLPADTGMTFMVSLPPRPDDPEPLRAFLSGATPMKVVEAETDGSTPIAPDTVHVAPPGLQLLLSDRFSIAIPPEDPERTADTLFRSVASARGRSAIGVVLSGGGTDGTLGLKSIKAEGGITIAQTPGSARADGMPSSAIEAGVVDLARRPYAIAAELARMACHPFMRRAVEIRGESAAPEPPNAEMVSILSILKTRTGVDFVEYREAALLRRLSRRLVLHRLASFADYVTVLRDDPGEAEAVFDDILLHVTSFFRDPEIFEMLAIEAFPRLLRDRPHATPIRIWAAGCSTGEEAYSLAISFCEFARAEPSSQLLQVFGGDLSAKAIAKARRGFYPAGALEGMGRKRLERYFTKVGGGYQVAAGLREICTFTKQDLATDPPFARLDLISCRNVLIYFEPTLQRRVLSGFHRALRQPGLLLVARNETLSDERFQEIARGSGLFARLPPRPHDRRAEGPERIAEELAATNAEILSMNEELHSVNEELELAKARLQDRTRELEEANRDHASILASLDIPIVVVDSEQRLRRFTPKAGALMGITAADVARPVTELWAQFSALGPEPGILPAVGSHEVREVDARDRSGRWHRLQIRPLRTEDSGGGGAVLAWIDIDRLKREVSEAEWARDFARNVVESVPVPLVVLDETISILSANAAFYRRFGGSRAELEMESLYAIAGGAWAFREMRRLLEGVLQAGSDRVLEVEREIPGHGKRCLSIIARPIRSTSERTPMILLSIDDVTEVRRAERERSEQVRQAQVARAEAEGANQAKDMFLAVLSHELRTPLNTLLLQAHLLRSGAGDIECVMRSAAVIERATKTQARLVEDLLDISRMITGKFRVTRRPIAPRPVVSAAVEAVAAMAAAKGVAIETAYDPGDRLIDADFVRLQQVVWNLLANAVKFTPPGGKVRVSVAFVEDRCRMRIEDDGNGIDPAFLPHVFERFSQAEPKAHAGLGLGLAIVRTIVEMHGGSIVAESAGRGLGATFTVDLPLLHPSAGEPKKALLRTPRRWRVERPAARSSENGGACLLGLFILVVEDDPDTRDAVENVLKENGADVVSVSSAEDALRALAIRRPDLIVSDIGLPGEDGHSLLREIHARYPGMPAVAMTAFASREDRKRALRAGFLRHLAKPLDSRALVNAVRACTSGGEHPPPR